MGSRVRKALPLSDLCRAGESGNVLVRSSKVARPSWVSARPRRCAGESPLPPPLHTCREPAHSAGYLPSSPMAVPIRHRRRLPARAFSISVSRRRRLWLDPPMPRFYRVRASGATFSLSLCRAVGTTPKARRRPRGRGWFRGRPRRGWGRRAAEDRGGEGVRRVGLSGVRARPDTG